MTYRSSSIPRWLKHGVAVGLTGALLLGQIMTAGASAQRQSDEELEYELSSGSIVAWDDTWELDEDSGFDEEYPADFVILDSSIAGLEIHEYEADGRTPEEARDAHIGFAEEDEEITVTVLESDESDDSATGLWIEESEDGSQFAVFIQTYFMDDYLIIAFMTTNVEDVTDSFEQVTDTVTLEGEDPFVGIDGDEIAERVEAGAEGDPEPTEEANTDGYLATVEDQYDEWSTSLDRLDEILTSEDLEDEEIIEEMEAIIADFEDASDVVADLDASAEFGDVEDAVEAYADGLGEVADAWETFLDASSSEADDAQDALLESVDTANDLGADLEDALAEAS